MNIQLLRHATLLVELSGRRLLVDPMLSAAGAMDPVANAGDERRIPLGELPLDEPALRELIGQLDAVLVTHTHRDHWDARAIELLPRDLPIFCQLADAQAIAEAGFRIVVPIETTLLWEGITFTRTGGQHGNGEVGRRMGTVSGFVLAAANEPTLYIGGDTIWCDEVAAALASARPEVVVLNAGAAQFLDGGPITMTAEDVAMVGRAAPAAQIIAVHMEAVNHCRLGRAALHDALVAAGQPARVAIPQDGDWLRLASKPDQAAPKI